jgi:hypothetical protein
MRVLLAFARFILRSSVFRSCSSGLRGLMLWACAPTEAVLHYSSRSARTVRARGESVTGRALALLALSHGLPLRCAVQREAEHIRKLCSPQPTQLRSPFPPRSGPL